ncbi:uncharacterized protein LY89DRAFT_782989 [Mollisia scopiformis]|uniref:Uncharacterized protein n=1 Tax=Mollisia scopiformis TaxID=149040 RepID=A0A194X6B1_MOLSC|nr:uncharacterized protein LY89DRAFT_782989 [Mollisia scopiformis]KUJ15715.1 hypothetical protein LY89DRAFT_782989 [Mollisia scopiformis]
MSEPPDLFQQYSTTTLSPPPTTTLLLLHPLFSPSPSSFSSTHTPPTPPNPSISLAPLSKAWRLSLLNHPPIPHLIFDISLPNSTTSVYWDTAPAPTPDAVAVNLREVINIAVTIATETRMRLAKKEEEEGEVRFEVVCGVGDGVSGRGVRLLERWLGGLSRGGEGGEVGDV